MLIKNDFNKMKTGYRTYLLFVLLLIINYSFANPASRLDSLLKVLQNQDEGADKTETYFKITSLLIKTNVDSAKYYADKGMFYAFKNGRKDYAGKFYSALGDIYVVKNDLFKALDSYLNAIDLYKTVNDYVGMSKVYLVIGNIYATQGNFSPAIENYHKGLDIADSLGLDDLLPHFYNNIGELHLFFENYENAIDNYKQALDIYTKKNDLTGEARILSNICKALIMTGDVEVAENYLNKAHEIYDSTSNTFGLQSVFVTKGDIERMRGNYEKALVNYYKSLKHLQKLGSDYFGPKSSLYAELYNNLGFCHMKLNNYSKAKEYLLKAYDISEKTGLHETLTKCSQNLSELYEALNKPYLALEYYKKFKMFSDSISREQNLKKITQLEMQNKFDKLLKEKEVEELKYRAKQRRKEMLYLVIIVGVVALLVVLGLLFNTQRLKRKNLALEKEKLKSDLDYKNKELTTNVLYLLKKNEFIINISNQLKNSRYSFKPENRKIIDGLIHDMEQSTSKDIWKEFELRFQEVHSDFYNKLAKKFPDLSPNELKLCAFLRLNMSTKEISSITFQSYNSIIMARHRLRKKLGIQSNENLIAFLRQL